MRHGFLLVDKPTGITSHTAVAIVRKRLSEKDVGHIGTLDPAASGLLVLAVGSKALKVIELFEGLSKEYRADIEFGSVSSTYDREGVIEAVTPKAGCEEPTDSQIKKLIDERFLGKISQVPPAFSAVHINGQRAYDLARQGKQFELQARTVQIESCSIVDYHYPRLILDVHCGSGTYIRSLAHDLGQAVRCGGYLAALRRTRVGKWSVENAKGPDDVAWTDVIPLKDILTDFPRIDLSDAEWNDISHGRTIGQTIAGNAFGWHEGLPVALLIPTEAGCRPRKVL
jgi:tRNA pseudouridine55 synthase